MAKLQKKRTLARKPRQRSKMSDQTDDNTIVLDLGNTMYGAGTSYISGGAGCDTITLDPSWSTGSITVPNGGYTIASGATSSSYTWTGSPYYSTSTNNVHIDADGLTMKEGADIKIGGKSLVEAIEKIEERLGILHPNPGLEDRWEQLKALRQQYIDLEKELLEKEKMWKILKEK